MTKIFFFLGEVPESYDVDNLIYLLDCEVGELTHTKCYRKIKIKEQTITVPERFINGFSPGRIFDLNEEEMGGLKEMLRTKE